MPDVAGPDGAFSERGSKHAAFAARYGHRRRLAHGLDAIKAMPADWSDEQRWAQLVELYDELLEWRSEGDVAELRRQVATLGRIIVDLGGTVGHYTGEPTSPIDNAAIDADIRERAEEAHFGDMVEDTGLTAAYLDEDADLVERPDDDAVDP